MRAPLIVAALTLMTALGCADNLDPATPAGAMNQLRDAVMVKDLTRIRAASSASTEEKLEKLHGILKTQRAQIATHYPPEHQATAYAVIAKEILEAEDTEALFVALVTPQLEALEASEGLRFGMSATGPVQSGEAEAKVTTQSKETIGFVLEDGVWKTTVFERQLDQNIERAELNGRTLKENLQVIEELKRRAARKSGAAAKPVSAAAP